MINAFELLGATPLDNREQINELFEDKQLICDNEKELALAYSELTTPKKRIKSELLYYSDGAFDSFNSIYDNPDVNESEISFGAACDAIISVGKWLDNSMTDIYDRINSSREISGFPILTSISVLYSGITEIKDECINNVEVFLDNNKENDVTTLYNTIVKKDDFQCFLVDELLARYEMSISESIQEKENKCNEAFTSIEKTSKAFFNNQGSLQTINKQINDFKVALMAWDGLVQPLQVNAQKHGANHERSALYVHDIRNKVIDLSNKSQEYLVSYINRNTPISPYSSKKTIAETLYNYIFFCDVIISLIRILQGSFAEIETTAEQLKKDVVDISGLKTTLNSLVQKVDPYGYYKNSSTIIKQTSSVSETSSNSNSSSSTEYNGEWFTKNKYKLGFGIAAVVCLILMIVGFSIGNNAMGVAFLVIGLSCGAFIALEKKARGNSVVSKVIVGITIVVLLCSVIPTSMLDSESSSSSTYSSSSSNSSSSNSSSSNSGDYKITFNKQGGSGGSSYVYVDYNSYLPSASAPTKSGYTFGGYFTSTGGSGTQYYSSTMSSVNKWKQSSGDTLYAYWISNDTGIKLTASNFESYFTVSTSASWSGTSFKVSYTITPKSSYYYDSQSSSSITVSLKVSISASSYGSAFKTSYINVTLYKSSNYKKSGTETIYLSTSYSNVYWGVDVSSCSGTIYD